MINLTEEEVERDFDIWRKACGDEYKSIRKKEAFTNGMIHGFRMSQESKKRLRSYCLQMAEERDREVGRATHLLHNAQDKIAELKAENKALRRQLISET